MIIQFCYHCGTDFETKMKNQKYCSVICRDIATRQKIEDRALFNRTKKRLKNPRLCKGGCGTIISIYNDKGFCSICQADNKKVQGTLDEIRMLFEYEKTEDI